MKLLKIFTEEIDGKDAHTEEGSLRTVLDGERDIGYIGITKPMIGEIEKQGLMLLPIRMLSMDKLQCIIYRSNVKDKALELYDIAKSKGGYLKDETPAEAREIGELLGYSEQSINEFIWNKYRDIEVPSENPHDYSDFH